MDQLTLSRKVYRLHITFVRKMNDAHFFVRQSIRLLKQVKEELESSTHKKDRRYYVPAVGRTKFARRKNVELKEIYDRFIRQELFENLIVTAVSKFESFLFDALKVVLLAYPPKLTLNIRGMETTREMPLEILLNSPTREAALSEVIERRLRTLSYASPSAYLEYLNKAAGVDTSDPAFRDYAEIKATRDLIIHITGTINQVYLEKAGAAARGKLGEKAVVDSKYFDQCIGTLKRLSGIVRRDVESTFPDEVVASQPLQANPSVPADR